MTGTDAEMSDTGVANQGALIGEAARDLRAGRVIGLPTDTVYGLAAALDRPDAIADLYAIKGRPTDRPLPILLAGIDGLELVALPVSARVRTFLNAIWPGGLTVALVARDGLPPETIAPDGTVGVRVPDASLAVAVLRAIGGAAAVTSANRSGEPALRTDGDVSAAFGDRVGITLPGASREGALPSTVVGFDVDALVLHRSGSVPWERLLTVWEASDRGPVLATAGPGTVR